MKKLYFLIAVLIFSLQITKVEGQNSYDPYCTVNSALDWDGATLSGTPSSQSYGGEYQIFLNNHYWNNSTFNNNTITYKIEVVSFPFTTNSYNAGHPAFGSMYTNRTLKMPSEDYTMNPYNKFTYNQADKGWKRDALHTLAGREYGFLLLREYSDTYDRSLGMTTESDLASYGLGFNANSLTTWDIDDWGAPNRKIFPHSILKHTFYMHCGGATTPVVDSFSFILDHTRGRMRNYPFIDILNPSNAPANHDITIFPSMYKGDWNLGDNVDNSGYNDQTINYFPRVLGDEECTTHVPSMYDNTSNFAVDAYFRPAPYSLVQTYLANYNGSATAGASLPPNTPPHQYIIDQPIDLNLINPSEKIIYNPSEASIDLDNTINNYNSGSHTLVFPSGYTFKTVSGKYPSKTDVLAADPYHLHIHPEQINAPSTLCNPVSEYTVEAGSTLEIGDCVSLYDVKITVKPGANLSYNHFTLYGNNHQFVGAGNIVDRAIAPSEEEAKNCPFNCYDYSNTLYSYDLIDHDFSQNGNLDLTSFDANGGDGVLKIGGTLTVKSGYTLNVTGPIRVEFGERGKIVVEDGAKLIANGTSGNEVVFTSANFCKQSMWEGIEVWGVPSNSLQNSNIQGVVQFNHVKLSNARNGIATRNGGDNWNYNGGIIRCSNVEFKNNRRSIEILSFHRRIPSGTELANLSYFHNCQFYTDGYLNEPGYKTSDGRHTSGHAHVTMWGVKNVNFQNCIFQNLTPDDYETDTRGIGIYTIDAAVQLTGGTNANIFKGLSDGVWCSSTGGQTDYISVDGNHFTNNVHGLTLDGTMLSNVSRNIFEIPAHEPNSSIAEHTLRRGYNKPTGLYLIGAMDFTAQENKFGSYGNGTAETLSYNYNYGMVVNNCSGSPDINTGGTGNGIGYVYKNYFTDAQNPTPLNVNLQCELDNKGIFVPPTPSNPTSVAGGLEYKCNEFNNRKDYDVTIPDGANFSGLYSLIRDQGLCNDPYQTDPNIQAGNTYSSCVLGSGEELYFGSPNSIWYNSSFKYNDQPSLFSCSNLSSSDNDCFTIYGDNTCPSNFGSGLNTLSQIRDAYFNSQYYANLSRNNYIQLLDGGNTNDLLNDVTTLTSPILKSLLLSKSPYLSDTVLLSMMERADTLPTKDIQQIIIANSPITNKVMSRIETKTYYSKIIDNIAPYQKGTSPRLEKEKEVNYYSFQSNLKTVLLKQAYLDISNLDSLASVSQKDSTIMGNLKLIGVLIGKKDFANAHIVLNEIFTKEGANLSDETKLNAMSLVLAEQDKSWFDLPDSLMQAVKLMYDAHPETAINARAILALTKGLQYERYPFDLEGGEKRLVHKNNNTNPNKHTFLNVFPNPADNNFKMEFNKLTEGGRNKIVVYNSLGGIEKEIEIQSGQMELFINSKEYAQGVYLLMLMSDDRIIDKTKILIIH